MLLACLAAVGQSRNGQGQDCHAIDHRQTDRDMVRERKIKRRIQKETHKERDKATDFCLLA